MKTNSRAFSKWMRIGAVSAAFAIAVCASALAGASVTPVSPSVPELDSGSIASGVALLIGGALLVVERYRRRH